MEEERRAERIHHLSPGCEVLGDVSESGMCLRMERSVPVGSLLSLELTSKDLTVLAKARVVYVKPSGPSVYHTGLHFIDLDDKQKQNLFDMVDSFAKGVPIRAKAVNL